MARSRKPEGKWLQGFLGLYKSSYDFFVVHPKTGGKSTFDTRDRSAAISRWVEKIFETSASWVS
jgi:hypothetical protein